MKLKIDHRLLSMKLSQEALCRSRCSLCVCGHLSRVGLPGVPAVGGLGLQQCGNGGMDVLFVETFFKMKFKVTVNNMAR